TGACCTAGGRGTRARTAGSCIARPWPTRARRRPTSPTRASLRRARSTSPGAAPNSARPETPAVPTIWRVYSGADGRSHLAQVALAMKQFVDVEGAHGEAAPTQPVTGITFRVSPPGYVLDWHCAPRRQYSISLSGTAEIEVGDGTVARVGPGDVVL